MGHPIGYEPTHIWTQLNWALLKVGLFFLKFWLHEDGLFINTTIQKQLLPSSAQFKYRIIWFKHELPTSQATNDSN